MWGQSVPQGERGPGRCKVWEVRGENVWFASGSVRRGWIVHPGRAKKRRVIGACDGEGQGW